MSNKEIPKIKIDSDKLIAAITNKGFSIHRFISVCNDTKLDRVSASSFRRYLKAGAFPYAIFSHVISVLRIYPEDVIADGELNSVIFVDHVHFDLSRFEGVQWTFKNTNVIYSWYTESPEKTLTNDEAIKIIERIRDEEPEWTGDAWLALDMAIEALIAKSKEAANADV